MQLAALDERDNRIVDAFFEEGSIDADLFERQQARVRAERDALFEKLQAAEVVADDAYLVMAERTLEAVAQGRTRHIRCGGSRYPRGTDDTMDESRPAREPIVLLPGAGREYPMGRISALFKADGAETAQAYSISEWWLEPNTKGPGAHSHPGDDVFYVIQGTMSVLVGDTWVDASAGSFVLIPGGVTHDFENRSSQRAGVLNFFPGVFEPHMKDISDWFARNPPGDAR